MNRLKPMNAEKLRQARAAAKQRFVEIAIAETPPEVRLIFPRRSLSGRAGRLRTGGYVITAPRPFTRKALYIYLHECAHVALGHCDSSNLPRHRVEFEAERWAHAAMRKHGLSVPRKMTIRAKNYVARKIKRAIKNGAKQIDREAAAYAGVVLPPPPPPRPTKARTIRLTLDPDLLQALEVHRRSLPPQQRKGMSQADAVLEVLRRVL